ncbi:MAG TPA: glycerophosphodiester phosphodiesterase [Candidatus Thermoplasmatota archaeon]|nr:glycerophosphodiester phosphodiesterase [Candidatus Thermoplasmatota archaeon]
MPFLWDRPPRVIGHRGAPRDAPENTLASFHTCARGGVRAAELDARLTEDGAVVVHHDAFLGRIIPGEGAIERMRADELRAKGVPLLEEVLALGLAFDVELKADADNAAELPAKALEVVRRADAVERVLVTSFDWDLADAYARLSGRPAGMILPFVADEEDLASYPRLGFVALAEDAALPEAFAACRAAERRVLVWTVNSDESARRLLDEGADGIITDRPGPLARALGEAASAP